MNTTSGSTGFRVASADPQREQDALRRVRDRVFIEEQKVPREIEQDALDPLCFHVLAFDADGAPIGTGRLTPDGRIGRMAVLAEHRGKGVGAALLELLIAEAQARGLAVVELHAQIDAVAFYQRNGFDAEGEIFLEAGIQHRHMRRELGGGGVGATVVDTQAGARDACLRLASSAARRLWIHSRNLDPLLLGDPEVMEQLRRIGLAGRGAEILVLVHEPAAAQREGHPLLALGQRLSSVVQFRTPVDEVDRQFAGAVLLNDAGGYFQRPLASRFDGTWQLHAPGRHRQLLAGFREVWERSQPSTGLRALAL